MVHRCGDNAYNPRISLIQCQQIENLNYCKIEDLTITNITKMGNLITINAKTKLAKNAAIVRNAELTFVFDEGVSDNSAVNWLFADFGRYIKE